ncbi:hypothetical protein [Vibrio rarus]|uniref:hypothetical protein n=1 Tax=Vibrio rarus TaxID=413403 RepID=UPI0021C27C2C|nr:hypothetical protein [Vibrio rarus]
MFDLICHIEKNRNYDANEILVIESSIPVTGTCKIPEDAHISFELVLTGSSTTQGIPLLFIGDIPVELKSISDTNHSITKWESVFINPFTNHKTNTGQPFRNNAGFSEFLVQFSNAKKVFRVTVDVLATKENEQLSREMLDYLSLRFSDVVNLCFSRTMVAASHTDALTECNISRLIKEAEKGISTVERSWPIFSRTIRTTPERMMSVQRGGVPDSPEGVTWLSQNQSNIVLCDSSEQTLKINNFSAKLIDGAVEVVNQNANIKENRVILSYLFQLQQKLKFIKRSIDVDNDKNESVSNEYLDYVSLDNIISQYREPVVKDLIRRVVNLEKRAVNLYKKLSFIMKEAGKPSFEPPIMTPFISRNAQYRRIYTAIFDWYKLGDVVFTDTEVFYGLRSLTTIYEFSCLVMILDSFTNMNYKVEAQEWRDFSVKSFGGGNASRPINRPNNYFFITSPDCEIEMYYEPKIWRKCYSNIGDPVVVLAEHQHFDEHHLSPDFLLKVKWRNKKNSDLLIFDAKYSPASSVQNYSLDKLISRYFFGIHQIGQDGSLGRLPTQAVWALYPKRGKQLVNSSFYAEEHCLSGQTPLLPSLGGINLRPSKQVMFQGQLQLLMDKLAL